MRVPDADLHGQHLRSGVVLHKVSQVSQSGHYEVGLVAVELQLQEAVAFGQRGVGCGAGPALQTSPYLWAVEAAGRRTAIAACYRRRVRGITVVTMVTLTVALIKLLVGS